MTLKDLTPAGKKILGFFAIRWYTILAIVNNAETNLTF